MPIPEAWEIEQYKRIKQIRENEQREQLEIPLVPYIERTPVTYVPSVDEERRGCVIVIDL